MSGYGLMQMNQSLKQQGMNGLADSAKLEQERNRTNEMIDAQKKQTQASSAGSGAATGAMIGLMAGGPPGMLVGAAIGGLGGWLLSS